MKIAVVGTGAVGGYFGSLLFQSGVDVTFIGTPESSAKIKRDGLVVNNRSYQVNITDSFEDIKKSDLVLLAVKSYHLSEVAIKLRQVVSDAIFICLQNGIDNDLRLRELVSNLNIHPGLVYVSAKKVSSGVISQSGSQRILIFGRRDKTYDPKLVEIEKVLQRSGIDAFNSMNIEKDLWQKFIFVISFAAVTVRFKTGIGPALADPIMRNYYIQSLREVIAVARAEGIILDSDIFEKTVAGAENFPPETKSSLLVDLENHRETEINTLHGTVVKLARKHGLPMSAIQEFFDVFS
jgi:2-dehydropantoate 2-reductase